jgi:gliding motility-associated-like protein
MIVKAAISLFLLVPVTWSAKSQSCYATGQTPATAFPVCSTDTISQPSVPQCTDKAIPAGRCGNYVVASPFWYQFTCFQSGALGFLIIPKYLVTPQNLTDDYNWELFDITNHEPDDVFTDPSLFVGGNWSGTAGVTGTAANAIDSIECASDPRLRISPYSIMPALIQGHVYLLLVSHFTQNASGFQLVFGGGTASITNPPVHSFQTAYVQCDGETISIKINHKVKCSSLAADGSDFSISSPSVSILSAVGFGCSNGIDPDSIILQLNHPLTPGNYTITSKIGSDGNTLLDQCENSVAVEDSVSFSVYPLMPTKMDSLAPIGCLPHSLKLVFKRPIQCSSIAADGSDFSIIGSSPVTIQSASGNCTNNESNEILLQLSSPILTAGTYQIKLLTGSDGNTIIDACNQQTDPGSTLDFIAIQSVSAQFSYQVLYGCTYDSIQFSSEGKNGANLWQWSFNGLSSNLQNPLFADSVFGQKQVRLIVSNGTCSDTSSSIISLDNKISADFTGPDNICAADKIAFQNNSIGNIVSWNWDFGDGTNSTAQTPAPHSFPPTSGETKYIVSLTVEDNFGCHATASKAITKLHSCYIAVPSGFTPNGDGHNDYLYPLNAYKADNLIFKVYNRNGQLLFETRNWTNKWDGTFNGKLQDSGTYAWTLQYTDRDTGKKIFLKGTATLIR